MFSIKGIHWCIPIFFLLISCNKKKDGGTQGPPPPPVVDVIVAGPSLVEENFEANGAILANESAELHPEISGRLVYLNMPDGAKVSKGTLLAKINDADLQAQLAKINIQIELAVKTEDRLKNLLAINAVNQADYDLAYNQLNSLKGDAAILQAQIDKTVIKAPFKGKLGLRSVSLGSYVTPPTLLGTIQQTDKLKIDFTVPEDYIDLIKIGSVIKVVLNDQSEFRKATITAVEPQLNLTTRNMKVRAALIGSGINPGTFVKIILSKGVGKEQLVVPTNAIIPEATSKKLVIVKRDSAQFIPVITGKRTPGGVEIISGLAIGDSVIVTGTLFVRPKQRVKIRSVKKLENLLK